MTLPEMLVGDPGEREPVASLTTLPAESDIVTLLARSLNGLFAVQQAEQHQRPVRGGKTRVIVFRGALLGDAEKLYPVVAERFRIQGFTPMMDRRQGVDIVLAIEGVIDVSHAPTRPWLHLLLLLLTIVTTTLAGAGLQGYSVDTLIRRLNSGSVGYLWQFLGAGAPFALTLLTILGVHEMGHYLAARRHGVSVTLPFFIPLPFIGILGTLGAVIFIRSPLTNRKALFDVGISGPLAGFVVALIAFAISLHLPLPSRQNFAFLQYFGAERVGMPILLQVMGDVLRPDIADLGRFVARQPVALAAWFGMLLTVLNLIPIGQLDGGHVMYTLFGKAAWNIALVVFGLMIFLTPLFPSLLFFALLALMTGLRHPPPGNDITPLDRRRRLLGYATIVLFFLIATITPFGGQF